MWEESPNFFTVKVEQAVDTYNDTPRSEVVGPPKELWDTSKKIWDFLLGKQREERQRANLRTRFCIVKGNLNVGQKVWIWNTKTVTLKDKLESWWEGPKKLAGKVFRSVWQCGG